MLKMEFKFLILHNTIKYLSNWSLAQWASRMSTMFSGISEAFGTKSVPTGSSGWVNKWA